MMVNEMVNEMDDFIVSDNESETEIESESEEFSREEIKTQIVSYKRQRVPTKRFEDETFVTGSGCCKRKGMDWTDMEYDGRNRLFKK